MRHHRRVPNPRSLPWRGTLALALFACSPGIEAPVAEPAASSASDPPASRPRLVIVLVVDQMRAEMLERYGPGYRAGMDRLRKEGVVFTRARHAHAVTYTAPGHATLATGRHPREHGIVMNSWVDDEGERHYAAADPDVEILGSDEGFHGAPTRVKSDTLGDWLQAAHPAAKVWSLALKDRAAVMMGGQHPDGVMWWNDAPARYVSSKYYFDALPDWLESFGESWWTQERLGAAWTAPTHIRASRPEDENAFEGEFSAFPHTLEHFGGSLGSMVRHTPKGEEMNFALARELIEREGLGRDEQPDLLWLGASASDWIGHRFGPRSHEMEAHHLELDRLIGDFLDFLDQRFPEGDYLLVLTSDHGMADVPESIRGHATSGERISGRPAVSRHLEALGASGACPQNTYDFDLRYGVTLTLRDGQLAPKAEVKRKCARALAEALRSEAWALEVLGPDELERPPSASDSPYAKAAKLSVYPGRAADVFVRLPEHHIFERGYKSGSSHGSAYTYDQSVPLIFFSPRLNAATRDEAVETVDLAPTLAPLLGAPLPPSLPGAAIPSMSEDFAKVGWPSTTSPQ